MKTRNARVSLLALFFILMGLATWSAEPPLLRVTFLDVHQGDCAIIRSAEKTIMIDAGDDNRDAANTYIIPYLKKEGIEHIDLAIISHPHRDHFGGYADLFNNVTFGEFYFSTDQGISSEGETKNSGASVTYTNLYNLIKKHNCGYTKAKPGDKLDFGKGIRAEVFYCEAGAKNLPEDPTKVNQNENSIILKVTAGDISYLFSGDAEKKAEEAAVNAHSNKLKSTVLKSGHHGSNTSSTHAFLDMVEPKYAIISVGEGNPFKHPTQAILDRYEYLGIKAFRTDKDGTVETFTDGKTISLVSNSTPLEFSTKPEIISLTANSATIQWKTNRAGTTGIEYGQTGYSTKKHNENPIEVHTVTLTGLKPKTKYKFKATSRDPRENTKIITFEGTVTTPAGSDEPLPRIQEVTTNYEQIYVRHPFKIKVPVFNPADTAAKNFTLEIFHSSMYPSNLIDKVKFDNIPAKSAVEAIIPTEINWIGNVEIIAVLKDGRTIIDTASVNIEVNPKLFMVDVSHGNIDYFTGKFAGMKMDIYKELGFQMKSIYKGITYDKIKDAFVVCIPHPKEDFTKNELDALKRFVSGGGSIMLFGMADYRNYSNPDMLNDVLKAAGSKIRFNDDQLCDPNDNIGPPWKFFVTSFPNSEITGKEVKKLLTKSACSLVNDKYTALKGNKTLKIIAASKKGAYNSEADNLDDGYIYASGTSIIPLAATEDLGSGRVACIGDQFYFDLYYNNPADLDTIEFNRNIIEWLGLSKAKTLKQMFMFAASLENEEDPELRADKFKNVSTHIMQEIKSRIESDQNEIYHINEIMDEHESEPVNELRNMFNQMIKFDELHQNP
jgi:competence protein ComEC